MTTPLLRQAWTMSAVLINMFGQGLVVSYPSSLLPALDKPDSPIKVDLHSSSWLGSILGLAGIPGFLISSVIMDLYGRRMSHLLVILPGVVGWLLIYFGQDVTMLMVGRFLGGMSTTGSVNLGAIIVGEYTSPKNRGVFLCLKNATVCMGAMFMHIGSQFLHWRTIALVSLIPSVVALLITYTWPESPAWLILKCQYQQSKEAFYWLRGNSEASQREIEDVIKSQRAKITKSKINCCDEIFNFFRKFTQKDFLKPFFIMFLASAVLELSGRHMFSAYALHIMAAITGENSHAFYYTLGIDVIITVSSVCASILVRILNRRTLLFSTGFASLVVLMLVCSYLFLASKNIIPNDRPWIPISFLILYFILSNLGCAPIPLAIIGEIFPLAHKGVGSAFSGVWIAICLLVCLKSAPHLLDSVGAYGFFSVYGSIMGVTLFILYFLLPETKDKTLQEIENYFNYGNYTIDREIHEEANIKMIKNTNDIGK